MANFSESARAEYNAYQRKWRKEHKQNVRQNNARYWQRRAERMAAQEAAGQPQQEGGEQK